MFSPLWNSLTIAKRLLNRRLAAGVWIICLIVLFVICHLALLRFEKTRDFNASSFQNSTIEKLFQRLIISDQSLCGSACIGESENNIDTSKNHINSEENDIFSNLDMPNGQDVNDIIDSEELEKESFQGKKQQPGATLRVHLPEREVVAHPEQYQKDVAKLIRNEWTDDMIKRQEDLFRKRSAHVEEVCNSLTLNGALAAKMGSVFENMRWISKHNMIWCPIFKAASTTWVKNLLMIAGESKIHARSLHARARQLFGPPNDPRVRDKLLRESQRMMIVRHPLERLLSAYRDKMLRVRHAHDPFVRIQKAIMLKYPDPDAPPPPAVTAIPDPKNMTDKLPTTHPTFKQFLMKARDDLRTVWNNKGKTIVNMHWRPFWLTCAPCHVIYDYIGKVETLDWDQEYIIRKMGLQDLLYNAHTHSSNFDSYNTTSEAARDYFKQVPLSLLKDVVELYKPDFLLFDYSPDSYYKLAKPDA